MLASREAVSDEQDLILGHGVILKYFQSVVNGIISAWYEDVNLPAAKARLMVDLLRLSTMCTPAPPLVFPVMAEPSV